MGDALTLHGHRVFPPLNERLRDYVGHGAMAQRLGDYTFLWPEGDLDEAGGRAMLRLRVPGMPLELLPVASGSNAVVALYVSPTVGTAAGREDPGFPVVLYLPEDRAAMPIASCFTGLLHFVFACCRETTSYPESRPRSPAEVRLDLVEARKIDAALRLGHRFELQLPDPEARPIHWHAAFLDFDANAPYSLAVEAQGAAERREFDTAREMLARAVIQAPWFAPIHLTAALLALEERAIPAALWSFYRALVTPTHGSGEGSRSPFYGLPLAFELDLDPTAFCRTYRASAPPDLVQAPFWELVVSGDPGDPGAWRHNGRQLAEAGDDLAARTAFIIARDLDPADDRAREELERLATRTGDWLLAEACAVEQEQGSGAY